MAFLSGPTPGEGHEDIDTQRLLDYISEQPTVPTPAHPEYANRPSPSDPTTNTQEADGYGYQISPILEHAIQIAKTRNFVIPLCPLDLMEYEEREGRFINLDNTVPQFCWHHQRWLKEGTPSERYIKARVMHTALTWFLWPPGAKWPELGDSRG